MTATHKGGVTCVTTMQSVTPSSLCVFLVYVDSDDELAAFLLFFYSFSLSCAMAEPLAKPISPISQVLQSIGLTRDDLLRHSDHMRQFLTQNDVGATRPFSVDPPEQVNTTGGSSGTRSVSRSNAPAHSQTSPPSTPVKSEPIEPAMPLRQMDSMEMILERKSRQAKREKKARGRDRPPPSPSPAHTSFSLDAFMQSRDSRRVPDSDQSDSSSTMAPQVRHVQCHVLADDISSDRTQCKIIPSLFLLSHHNIQSTIEIMTLLNPLRVTRRSLRSSFPRLLYINYPRRLPLLDLSLPLQRVLAREACLLKYNLHHRTWIPLLHVETTTTSRPSLLLLLPHAHLPSRHPPRSASLILYHHQAQWVLFQMKMNTTNYPTRSPLVLIQRKNQSCPTPPLSAKQFSLPPNTGSRCKRFTTGSPLYTHTSREMKLLG